MPGIGIILNPHSRANRKNPRRARRLGFIVGDKGSCHETKSLADVEKLAAEFRDRDIDILGISGGDGTLHGTLTAFVHAYGDRPLPKIAFLRGGTMNNTASCLKIRGTPERILSNLILKYHSDEPFRTTELDLLEVNGRYGFIFGMGVVSRFLEHYEQTEGEPTPLRAALLLLRYMLSGFANGKATARLCSRFDATITVGGKPLPFRNYTMLFAGTIETLCFNFRPLYRAREIPNHFQFVGISATPRQLLTSFPSAMLARPSGSECFADVVGQRAVIELAEPMIYTIDGDFPEGPTERIEVGMGPRVTCILA